MALLEHRLHGVELAADLSTASGQQLEGGVGRQPGREIDPQREGGPAAPVPAGSTTKTSLADMPPFMVAATSRSLTAPVVVKVTGCDPCSVARLKA